LSDQPDRLPPHDRGAERAVLGSCLRDNTAIADVAQILRAEDFYLDAHQRLYKAISGLADAGKPVDLVTMADVLRDGIADVGGYPYLGELWDAAPTAANAEYYARIVRDRALARGLIHAFTDGLRDAYGLTGPAEGLLESRRWT
jgi:replicative DNA helicase